MGKSLMVTGCQADFEETSDQESRVDLATDLLFQQMPKFERYAVVELSLQFGRCQAGQIGVGQPVPDSQHAALS